MDEVTSRVFLDTPEYSFVSDYGPRVRDTHLDGPV